MGIETWYQDHREDDGEVEVVSVAPWILLSGTGVCIMSPEVAMLRSVSEFEGGRVLLDRGGSREL